MSEFVVPVVIVGSVAPIEGADRIEIARIAGYQVVIAKGSFHAGDRAIYIPEASIIPEGIIKWLGLEGRLAGSAKNRVKAIRLKGVLSQGLLYPLQPGMEKFVPDTDVAERLGITKYEPPIPISFSGKMFNLGSEKTVRYDVEHLKKYPEAFGEIDQITITEKIHGTNIQIGILKNFSDDRLFGKNKNIYVTCKGMGGQGLVFNNDVVNVYTKAYNLIEDQLSLLEREGFKTGDESIHLIGEVFGRGIQDLGYNSELSVRFFDVKKNGRWLPVASKYDFLMSYGLQSVPILYQGNYSKEVIDTCRNRNTIVGAGVHMIEGIVITANDPNAFHPKVHRPVFKALNDEYVLRDGGTEYN